MHLGYWWVSQTEIDHKENHGVSRWRILKWVLDRMGWYGMEWNGMEWNGMEWNGMAWHGPG
jgi:hypothetical protein